MEKRLDTIESIKTIYGLSVQEKTYSVPVPAGGTAGGQFSWPRNMIIEGRRLLYILVYSSDDLQNDPQGFDLVDNNIFTNAFLTLVDNNNTRLYDSVPLVDFNPRQNAGIIKCVEGVYVMSDQCFFQVAPGPTLVANTVFYFKVGFYDDKISVVSKQYIEQLERKQ